MPSFVQAISGSFHLQCRATSISPSTPSPSRSVKKRPRKPPGYWSDPATLSTELYRFCAQYSISHRMPTAAELLAAGRVDLYRAVQRNGGFHRVAVIIGRLPNRNARRTQLETALQVDISTRLEQTKHNQPPVQKQLSAVTSTPVADANVFKPKLIEKEPRNERKKRQYRRLGPPRRARGYWSIWRNLETELRGFAKRYCSGFMPQQRQLRAAHRSDIMNAVQAHGGSALVARRAGLSPGPSVAGRKPRGHWSEPGTLHAELLTFTARHGHPGLMPRREQLLRAGRGDLNYAIMKHGGYSSVAASLYLVWHGPSSYWRVFRNLHKRLLTFVRLHKRGPIMPSFDTLQRCGRMDLVYGIALHGGVMMVARRTGLAVSYPNFSPRYWENPANIQRELEQILLTQPLEARHAMPSSVLLVQAGRADLATAIRDHGGWLYYAQRLGLRFQYEVRHQGFWAQRQNVLLELLNYVALRYGTWEHPGKPRSTSLTSQTPLKELNGNICGRHSILNVKYIPSLEMLKRDGRSDIAFAIARYQGGMELFAKQHSLIVAEDVMLVKPTEELFRWVKFKIELKNWIRQHGSKGMMPSTQDLIRTGRHDLRYATYKHGGAFRVSKRMQLIYLERETSEWIPRWLGMQAGKLGLALRLEEMKENLSSKRLQYLEELKQELGESAGSDCSFTISVGRSSAVKNERKGTNGPKRMHKKLSTKPSRTRGTSSLGWRKQGKNRILSTEELEELRNRYKRIPPDDIIIV